MNTFKKTIFLKDPSDSSHRTFAILKIEKKNNNTFGEFKVYNGNNNEYILGIKSADKIIKQNISLTGNKCIFKMNSDIDINDPVSCILFKNSSEHLQQLLYGTERNDPTAKAKISEMLNSSIQRVSNIAERIANSNNSNHSSHDRTYNDEEIVYDKIYNDSHTEMATTQSTAQLFESDDQEIENLIDENMSQSEHNFYNMIAEQLDDLFNKYPREENLEALVPNSKWVRINHDYDNKYYVVGIIYDDNDIKYICYGVPGTYSTEPPKELIGYSQWLPVDVQDPYNNGYWVMYQDADTGENVYLN